jgi:hypothetical protein
MSKTHIITVEDGITRIKFLVNPTFELAKSIIDELAENYPYEKRPWDMNEIKFNFTTAEIQNIAAYGKTKFTKPNKLAVLALDDLSFGEMRQFMVYREEENKAQPFVFRKEEEAIEWLNS